MTKRDLDKHRPFPTYLIISRCAETGINIVEIMTTDKPEEVRQSALDMDTGDHVKIETIEVDSVSLQCWMKSAIE